MADDKLVYDVWPEVDPRFKIRIWSPKVGGITGLLPPSFSEKVSTQWAAPFNQIFAAAATGSQVFQQAEAFAAGTPFNPSFTLRTKKQTYMLWTGSSPLTVGGIKIIFISKDDAETDVLMPARRLQAMGTPRLEKATSELLEPPASLVIELGYILRLVDALITISDVTWHAPFDENGLATRAEVSLNISSRSAYVLDTGVDYVKPVGGWDKHPLDMLNEQSKEEGF